MLSFERSELHNIAPCRTTPHRRKCHYSTPHRRKCHYSTPHLRKCHYSTTLYSEYQRYTPRFAALQSMGLTARHDATYRVAHESLNRSEAYRHTPDDKPHCAEAHRIVVFHTIPHCAEARHVASSHHDVISAARKPHGEQFKATQLLISARKGRFPSKDLFKYMRL